jgi:hypothetical protein
MVAHYAKNIEAEQSAQRCAIYTIEGGNGDEGRVCLEPISAKAEEAAVA